MGVNCSSPHHVLSCSSSGCQPSGLEQRFEQDETEVRSGSQTRPWCVAPAEREVQNKTALPVRQALEMRRQSQTKPPRNPEVTTPKGPPKEPYALAGGLDGFGFANPIHDSLEPQFAPAHPKTRDSRQPFTDSRLPPAQMPGSDDTSDCRKSSERQRDRKAPTEFAKLTSSPSFGGDARDISDVADGIESWPERSRSLIAAYRQNLHVFLDRAECGVRCRAVFAQSARPRLATYMCHLPTGTLRIVPIASTVDQMRSFRIAGICNVSLSGEESAVSGTASGYMKFDTSDGDFSLLLEEVGAEEAQENFLDCIAVLIATLRARAKCCGEPPPCDVAIGCPRAELLQAWEPADSKASEGLASLRPRGRSLLAEHLTGHAGALLSAIGEAVVRDLRGDEMLV